jgi:hypothetical protein
MVEQGKTYGFGDQNLLNGRDTVSARLSTPRTGFSEDVLALERERDGLCLDERRVEELEVG